MNWQTLFDGIQTGAFARVYLFQGPETYVKRSAVEKLEKALLTPGLETLNKNVMEDADAQKIIECAETLPVMSERRLLIVRDYAPLTGGKAKDEQAQTDRLMAWLPNAPDTCVTVFYMRDRADSRKKLTKAIAQYGQTVDFEPLSDAQLTMWIRGQLKPFGKTMDEKAVAALTFRAGRLLTPLTGEMEKLCAYTGTREKITEDDVCAAVTPSTEATVFFMIDMLMDGKADQSFAMLNQLLETGESCVGALAMLTRQMRILTHVCYMQREKLPQAQIEKQTGLTHYVASRVYARCARLDPEIMEAGYRACVDSDFAIKSGKMRDQAALDRIMFELTAIFAKKRPPHGTVSPARPS